MSTRIAQVLCVAALACCVAGQAPAEATLLAGNETAVWLVRSSASDNTYDVAARQLDGEWKWVSKQAGGQPVAAAAVGEQLHLLFSRPLGYVMHDLRKDLPYDARHDRAEPGRNPANPRWSSDAAPIALCDAAGWGEAQPALSSLIAVVPAYDKPAADDLAPAWPATPARLGVFLKIGIDWSHVGELPDRYRIGPDSRLLATAVGEVLYVLVGAEGAERDSLLAWSGEQWQAVPTPDWPADARALAMLRIDGRLAVVLAAPLHADAAQTQPADMGLYIASHDDESRGFSVQPVSSHGRPIAWPPAALPLAAQLGDRIAMVWTSDDKLHTTTCGLTGYLLEPAEIELFDAPPTDSRGLEVLQVFSMGLLVALFVPLFLLRPPAPAKLFSLPPTVRPANPVKRLLAGLIDFLPCAGVAGLVFRVEPQSFEQLQKLADQGILPTNMAYAFVGTLLLYTAYALFMEWRFSATAGMMVLRLKVVGDEGTKPDARSLFLRNIFRILELLFTWRAVPWLLLCVLFTRHRQRLGDIFARTTLIDTSRTSRTSPPAPPPPDGPEGRGGQTQERNGADGETP